MTRLEQYEKFNLEVANLLLFAINNDIPIRMGEAHRPQEMADIYAKAGKGIKDSKHVYSLAIDLWITDNKTGKDILWNDPRYDILGRRWKEMGGIWGGDFKSQDRVHFEIDGSVTK